MTLSESMFQSQVKSLALTLKWRVYHTFDSRRSDPGFPDLVLVKPPHIIFAELKTDAGRLRPEQKSWLDDLDLCPGVETYMWRPKDFDQIVRILTGKTQHALPESSHRHGPSGT